jgi:hypothetical protein
MALAGSGLAVDQPAITVVSGCNRAAHSGYISKLLSSSTTGLNPYSSAMLHASSEDITAQSAVRSRGDELEIRHALKSDLL